jgi:hypothetical protein
MILDFRIYLKTRFWIFIHQSKSNWIISKSLLTYRNLNLDSFHIVDTSCIHVKQVCKFFWVRQEFFANFLYKFLLWYHSNEESNKIFSNFSKYTYLIRIVWFVILLAVINKKMEIWLNNLIQNAGSQEQIILENEKITVNNILFFFIQFQICI